MECGGAVLAREAIRWAGGEPGAAWTDSRLVRECLDGDERAWAALIAEIQNLDLLDTLSLGRRRRDAADIFQQVCLELFAELPRLRKAEALAGWLDYQSSPRTCRSTGSRSGGAGPSTRCRTWKGPGSKRRAPRRPTWSRTVEREQLIHEAVAQLPPRCRRDHPAAVLRAAAARQLSRSGRTPRSGDRLHRIHPRTMLEASAARDRDASGIRCHTEPHRQNEVDRSTWRTRRSAGARAPAAPARGCGPPRSSNS